MNQEKVQSSSDSPSKPSRMQTMRSLPAMLSTAVVLAALVFAQSSTLSSSASDPTSTSTSSNSSSSSSNKTVNVIPLKSIAVQPLPFQSRNWSEPYVPEVFLNEFQSQQQVASQPHFQVFDEELAKDILGTEPEIVLLINEPGYAFAHEAPVYFKDGTFTFCSDAGGPEGRSNATVNNKVFSMNLTQVLEKISSGQTPTFSEDVKELEINSDGVQMTNGGTHFRNQILLANSGRTEQFPGTLAVIDRNDPKNVTVLINQAFGKQFNSPNDVVVHPTSGAIFFTDALYGFTQNFRPALSVPQMTWRFDPDSGRLTALDDSIKTPNGLVLSKDGSKLYITDTGASPGGNYSVTPSQPSSIYVFDVNETEDKKNQYLSNRRLFTWVDTGLADGVKVDENDNLWVGNADGVMVYAPSGIPILKVYFPDGSVNLAFAGQGRLVITAQDKLWLAKLSPNVNGVDLEKLSQ